MKLATAALCALLTLVTGTVCAQAQTGSVITERPRDPGMTRDAYQDSTLAGGTGWNFPTRKTPPVMPPPAPTPDPCADPSTAGCDGTPATDPFDEMVGGCVVDTLAWDEFQADQCNNGGSTHTHAIGFSVGNVVGSDQATFREANTYRVVWTGSCTNSTTSYCSVSDLPNGSYTATATIYRISDNRMLGSLTITANKQVTQACIPGQPACYDDPV